MQTFWKKYDVIIIIATIKLILHFFANVQWDFHRDEFLYLALGKNPDWGYWSIPPSLGALSWFIQSTLGDSLFAIRLVSTLTSVGLVVLAGLMAREMGGNKFAQLLACLGVLFSISYLRSGMFLMPVPFNIFYWTLYAYLIIRFVKTENNHLLLWLGALLGLGMLNKYAVVFFGFGMVVALILTPYRKLFKNPYFYGAIAIGFLVFLPNLIWQMQYNFPVVSHIDELAEEQLVNVSYINFIADQLFFNIAALPLWISGIVFLFFTKKGKPFRVIGWIFVAVLLLLLVLHGKSYYTLGIYPMMIAAGAVYWVDMAKQYQKTWMSWGLLAYMSLLTLPVLPLGVPFIGLERMVAYCDFLVHQVGFDVPMRWEDGEIHRLPQDYADMINWEEIPQLVAKAYQKLPANTPCLIYADEYAHAGAIDYYQEQYGLPEVVSFSDHFRIWSPDTLPSNMQSMVYVNNNVGEDVQELFTRIDTIGIIEHPYMRETGTGVFLMTAPRSSFPDFWERRVLAFKQSLGLR